MPFLVDMMQMKVLSVGLRRRSTVATLDFRM